MDRDYLDAAGHPLPANGIAMGYVPPGPPSAVPRVAYQPSPNTTFYPFGKDSYETGCRPYEPQADTATLRHRIGQLEKRVDGLSALLATLVAPKDPNGSSGAPAAPAPIRLPAMTEQVQDIDLDTLILAQRQHHQQSPWSSRRFDVC